MYRIPAITFPIRPLLIKVPSLYDVGVMERRHAPDGIQWGITRLAKRWGKINVINDAQKKGYRLVHWKENNVDWDCLLASRPIIMDSNEVMIFAKSGVRKKWISVKNNALLFATFCSVFIVFFNFLVVFFDTWCSRYSVYPVYFATERVSCIHLKPLQSCKCKMYFKIF